MNWPDTFTFFDRYYLCGICNKIAEFCYKTGKRHLVIIDAGCSSGIAAHDLKSRLWSFGISSHIIGIDSSRKVQDEAIRNLDKFLLKDITKITESDITNHIADVVICCFVANYVLPRHRAEILETCSKLVSHDGIIITSVDCYENNSNYHPIRDYIYLHFPINSLMLGLNAFREEIKKRQIRFIIERYIRVLNGSDECREFPSRIIEGWNKRSPFYKAIMYIALITFNLSVRLNNIKI